MPESWSHCKSMILCDNNYSQRSVVLHHIHVFMCRVPQINSIAHDHTCTWGVRNVDNDRTSIVRYGRCGMNKCDTLSMDR